MKKKCLQRKYEIPSLYDKSNEGYKEEYRKKNAWPGMENACGYDEDKYINLEQYLGNL